MRSHRLGVLCLILACASPALAATGNAPPIADPASGEYHPGKVVFTELVTPDLARAKQFYGTLFGWTFRDVAHGRAPYAEADLDGAPVAGLVERRLASGRHGQSVWLNFFSTGNVDATASAAREEGGRIVVPAHDLPDRGREAVLADPQGAVFAVLASSSGDPPDVLAAPGGWIWRSLITGNPVAEGDFYRSVLGEQVAPAPEGGHLLMATENILRASINAPPAAHASMHPRWLAWVRVADVHRTAASVTALGGRILVAPRPDSAGVLIALAADPLGAPFGVMEWPDSDAVTK